MQSIPMDSKEKDCVNRKGLSLKGIMPICFISALLGLLHFFHGPFNSPIVGRVSLVSVALLMIVQVATLVGDCLCIGSQSFDGLFLEGLHIFLTLLSCLNAAFLIYMSSSQKRLPSIYKALNTADDTIMKREKWDRCCTVFFMIFCFIIHVTLLISYMVIVGTNIGSARIPEALFQCPIHKTLKETFLFIQRMFWVSTIVLPCCLYISLLHHGIACMGAVTRIVEKAVKNRTSWEELSSCIKIGFEVVDAINITFCWYLLYWMLNAALLTYVAHAFIGDTYWAIALVCVAVIGLVKTAALNYKVCVKLYVYYSCPIHFMNL